MRNAIVALAVLTSSSFVHAETPPAVSRAYKARCAACHGETGDGNTEQGKKNKVKDLTRADVQAKFTDAEAEDAINKGKKSDGGEMEGYADKLKPEVVKGLVAFIRTLKK